MWEYPKKIINKIAAVLSDLLPSETIESSKNKWNKLGSQNARYYVVSKNGFDINEDEFKKTGQESYKEHILNDEILRQNLGDFHEKSVLNIGCGIGRLEEFFAIDFKNAYGVDIAESMITQAKSRLEKYSNVHVQVTDGVSFPFSNNFFDFVFSYIVFQHMPSKKVVYKNFEEIFRVLKPGAIAKIQIRGGHQPFKWQWFYGPVWSKEEAVSMVEKIGFKVIKADGEKTKRFWLWIKK